MKFVSRLRFVFGILLVILLVGVLSFHLNNIMSVSQSSKAVLAADATSIGVDYAGLVVQQNAEEGDKVTKGQTLFEIQSSSLQQALASHVVTEASLPFSLDPKNGDIQLKASNDGIIESIDYKAGSYAPAGGIVAIVDMAKSLYVVANFRLSPPDYARISKNSKLDIELPDNSTKQATVFSIALVSNGNNVDTVVKARIKDANLSDFRFSVGTPVQATLHMSQNTWYQGVFNYIEQLFKPVGR